MKPKNTKAIFSIIFGEEYRAQWEIYCRPTWTAYAERHGYDIVVTDQPVKKLHDFSRRPIHWQKCFILQHPAAAQYEDIVFLDGDIVINHHRAPCIVTANNSDKVGMVRYDQYFDDDLYAYILSIRKRNFMTYLKRREMRLKNPAPMHLPPVDFTGFYREYPDLGKTLPLLNSGVLVMKPALHRQLLEDIYHASFDEARDEWVNGTVFDVEQLYLSYKLLQANQVNFLDERFNTIASIQQAVHYPFTFFHNSPELFRMCFTTMLCNCYFLHFARCASMMQYAVINEHEDFAIIDLPNVFAGDIIEIRHRRPSTIDFNRHHAH